MFLGLICALAIGGQLVREYYVKVYCVVVWIKYMILYNKYEKKNNHIVSPINIITINGHISNLSYKFEVVSSNLYKKKPIHTSS